jgi:hypothetical protein
MKLKSTLAALLLTASMSTFAVDITLSPVYTVVGVVQSALESVVGLVSSPLASTGASSQQREQLQAIRNDAVDFLSTGEMSARLENTLEQLKQRTELSAKSNVELSAHIVTAIN